MKHSILLAAIYLAFAVQVAIGDFCAIGQCRMPFMWLPVILALSWFSDWRGIVWSAIIGLVADGLSDGRLGVEMLATTLAAALALSVRPEESVRSRWPWMAWEFSAIATGLVLSHGLTTVLSNGPMVTFNSMTRVAGEAALGLGMCSLLGTLGAFRTRITVHSYHA